jgi:hypothetical protein
MNIVVFNKSGDATVYKDIIPFQNNMDQILIENSSNISQIIISVNEHLEYFHPDEFLNPENIPDTIRKIENMATFDLMKLKYTSLVLEILIKIYNQLL